MKGMFWGTDKVEVSLTMKMIKGRSSAQRGSAPWATMNLELDSTYSSGRTEECQQQQNGPNQVWWEKRYKIKLKQEKLLSKDGFRRCLQVPGFCMIRKYSITKQKKG